jgi:hypothetical protein
MAVLGFEGFDYFQGASVGPDLASKPGWTFSQPTNWGKAVGLLGGGAISQTTQAGRFATFTPGGNYGTIIAGIRWRQDNPILLIDVLRFYDGANVQCGVSVTAAGNLTFWRGTNATVLATGTSTLFATGWYAIECKVTFSTSGNSDGSFSVKLNGIVEISASGTVDNTTTTNATGTGVAIGFNNNSASTYNDDFYMCDNSGSVGNDFLSTTTATWRVETAFPTSNNAVAFTPLASTNVSQIQETSEDGDTSYNWSATTGQVDTFNNAALSSTPTTIWGVDVVTYMRKDDVTSQTVRTKLISGATTSNGASKTPDTLYRFFSDMYLTDPNTAGLAWTGTTVNAAKIGYEHV